jgi:long-chain acyl-CoA synthetase
MIRRRMPHTTDIIDPKAVETIAGLFRERVKRSPQACAYSRFSAKKGGFEKITWEEMSRMAARWQIALGKEGLLPGDLVAIAIKNCLEWVLFDLAALGLGLVTVPLFAFDRPENSAYILKETGARLILLDEMEQWLRIEEVAGSLPEIRRIVTLHSQSLSISDAHRTAEAAPINAASSRVDFSDGHAIRSLTSTSANDPHLADLSAWLPEMGGTYVVSSRKPEELATVVYTSGTTGMPKGVMLSHSNILQDAFACLQREPIYPDDVFLSFLPLSHTFERTVGYYIPMMAGACVAYVRSIDKLAEDLLEVRPTVLISVPRIWERIHKKMVAALEEKSALSRKLFYLAVSAGWARFLYLQGRRAWTPLLMLWPLLKKIVANRATAGFGDRLRLSFSGGAPLVHTISRVFLGLGLDILQGYGLTETSPVISFNTRNDNDPGTVGRLVPGVESVIAANGELLVGGPTVMLGYWHSSKATAAAIDPDGYFHTGDLARMDDSGRITIVGRFKEIIVLSTGEKVPPEDIELAVTTNPLFEQAMVVGEGRPYLAALVVLNRSRWEKLVSERGLARGRSDLPDGEQAEKILLAEIARRITRFPGYAQIRRVHAMFSPWEMKDGLITTTLKLRRGEILSQFEREVESLFDGH